MGDPGSTAADKSNGANGEAIRIRGARVHNLQNVDVDLPRDRLVVITGPSGSGKSSLAFDTLYAEGQRQYIESLSIYARQFLHQMERPDVDSIDGLQPTISIDQRAGSQNPRSTVATVTEIYDFLRLLFARAAEPFCHQCGSPISQQTPAQIQQSLLELPERTKAMILAPMVRGRKGMHGDVFTAIRKAGMLRVRIDGVVYELDHIPQLEPRKNHTIEAVVDRVIVRPGIETRLAESVASAVRHGDGVVLVTILKPGQKDAANPDNWRDVVYSTRYACPACHISLAELEPRTFSFNSPYGACPTCEGLGSKVQFDADLVLPDRSMSIGGGALAPWRGATAAEQNKIRKVLHPFLSKHRLDLVTPLDEASPKTIEKLLRGDGKKFAGLLIELEKTYATTTRAVLRQRLEPFRGSVVCSDCDGARIRGEARACRFNGRAIHEITAMTVAAAATFFAAVDPDAEDAQVARPMVREIARRLEFLSRVGVDYVSLNRPADTLSGGELQRVRLATGIGSGLVGVCYILDEPSIGLHPRDNQRLIDALRDLQGQGSTVIVVEHDEAMMRQADHLIDIGPGAGRHGGRIVAQGRPVDVCADPQSVTGQYLSGQAEIAIPDRRRIAKTRAIQLDGVTTNNLQDVAAQFPLGALVCVTGVSGSGKSSLVVETLARALTRRLGGGGPKPGPFRGLRGVSQIDRLVQVDQSPIGRTPRSNPATYTGIFDEIRKLFAGTKQAKQHGYKAGRFSFNVKGGRCETCQGHGLQKIEMNFLPDLYVTCPECNGARFNFQTLRVRYRDRSIAEVLDMRIEDAVDFFDAVPGIARMVASLDEVGLGYLSLGQPSTTLSGGEAQRIKLAAELGRVDSSRTLYILDEPTTGLHFDDTKRLLLVLGRLVDAGNSVLVIEHNLDVLKSADWIIDLGPEGGEQGGRIVAAGPPEAIAKLPDNHTGRYLAPLLRGAG